MDTATDHDAAEREARLAYMWCEDRAERARRWNAAMARGVAMFWIEAGRPDLAKPEVLAELRARGEL